MLFESMITACLPTYYVPLRCVHSGGSEMWLVSTTSYSIYLNMIPPNTKYSAYTMHSISELTDFIFLALFLFSYH